MGYGTCRSSLYAGCRYTYRSGFSGGGEGEGGKYLGRVVARDSRGTVVYSPFQLYMLDRGRRGREKFHVVLPMTK